MKLGATPIAMRHADTGRQASRRTVIRWLLGSAGFSIFPRASLSAGDDIAKRFEFLSTSGNSNCSSEFLTSIVSMADGTRLQGSCCGPMSLHRYREQIDGLKAYSKIAEIPPDPYDVDAGLAKRLLVKYDLSL